MKVDQLRNAKLRDQQAGGRTYLVLDPKVRAGRIQLVEEVTGEVHYETWDVIRARVASGELEVDTPTCQIPVVSKRSEGDDQCEAAARAWLMRWTDMASSKQVSPCKAYKLLKDQEGVGTNALPSMGTLYRYLKRHEKGEPLVRSRKEKGNRNPRYRDEIRELVCDLAAQLYLQSMSRWTMRSLVKHINEEAQIRRLLPEGRKLSREYVQKVIREDLTTDVLGARMPGEQRIAARAIAKERIRVGAPLQRVEQDALHLPFVVQTPHGISREVYLVHAIDCAHSIPLGWKIVIGYPQARDTKKCLERTLFPKQDALLALGVHTFYDLYGTPVYIVFDNGPEVPKSRMERLTRLGITVIYCKARAAQQKPFIERHNRSLKEALETLPGCTRFNGVDGARDPVKEGDALMTIDELEQWIVNWKFTKWINQPLKRLKSTEFFDEFVGQTPAQVYKTVVDEGLHALPLPPSPSAWLAANREVVRCTLSRKTGIKYDTFEFGGRNLPQLIHAYGEVVVDVHVDEDDFRSVSVPLTQDGPMLELTNKDVLPSTPAYSFSEAKAMRDTVREDPEGQEAARAFDRKLYARSAEKNNGAQPGKAKTKSKRAESKATTMAARAERAAIQAAQRPVHHVEPESPAAPAMPDGLWPTSYAKAFDVIDRAEFSKK